MPTVLTVLLALVLGAALTACSPTFDWRTIMNNDDGYTVDLPAKPGNDERTVQIGGTPMQMVMPRPPTPFSPSAP